MPKYQPNDVVYSTRRLEEHASGDSPGGLLCHFADKLIIRKETWFDGKPAYSVSHEHRTDGCTFAVLPNEISYMKHFNHNSPMSISLHLDRGNYNHD